MKETDELYLLRFRYGRAAEILLAYKTFLHRQVNIGDKNYCQTDEHVRQVSHTLLVTFYSFIYSLFDKQGTNFISAIEPYVNSFSEDGKRILQELIDVWEIYNTPITKLRHNIGFHGGTKLKSQEVGYSALSEIHPQTSEFIMNHLAILFMELDNIVESRENYKFHVDPKARQFLFDRAKKLKESMNDSSFMKVIEEMKKLYV